MACVRLTARDAQGTPNQSAIVTVSAPALSALQTQGNIAEVWKATLALDGAGGGQALTNGDLGQVNAVVYPWIGDASAVLDTSDTSKGAAGTVTPGSAVDVAQGQAPLRFVVHRTGGYGGAHFAVKAGASGGTVQASYALALTTPFPTVQAGINALPAWNNTNKGHNDHSGGTGWLMDDGAGGAVDHTLGASTGVAGKCWTDIKVDPAAVGQVRLAVASNVNALSDLIRFLCPIWVNTAGAVTINGGSASNLKRIAFDGCTISYGVTGQTTGFCIQWGLKYWRNCTLSNVTMPFYPFTGATRENNALILGCTGTTSGQKRMVPNVCVGNTFEGVTVYENDSSTALPIDGGMLYNNRFLKQQASNLLAQTKALARFARVQNVFELAGVSAVAAWGIGNDGQTATVSGFVSMHNTVPGVGVASSNIGRQNAMYADVAGAVGVQKAMTERFDILHQRNCKTDTFTTNTSVTGRTGDWRYRYGVGNLGMVVVTGDAQAGLATAADPSGNNWSGEYLEPGSSWVAGEANVTFASNLSGTAGAGGGSYALTGGSNAALNRVPGGRGVLKYDIAGNARLNNGAGAAGAYERTA